MSHYHVSYSWLPIQPKRAWATWFTAIGPASSLLDPSVLCLTLVPLPNDPPYKLGKATYLLHSYFIPGGKAPSAPATKKSFPPKSSYTLLIWNSSATHLNLPHYLAHAAGTIFILCLTVCVSQGEVLPHQVSLSAGNVSYPSHLICCAHSRGTECCLLYMRNKLLSQLS